MRSKVGACALLVASLLLAEVAVGDIPRGPSASAEQASMETPAAVQVLDLTSSAGKATQIAMGGLGQQQAEAVREQETQVASSTSGGASLSPATVGRLRHALSQSAGEGERKVDPEKDATLLTEPLEVDDFLVAGFAWEAGGSLPEEVQIYLRFREKGAWSPWFLNEVEDSTGPEGKPSLGTGEMVTAGADAVQASVVLESVSRLAAVPKGLHLVLVPGTPKGKRVRTASDLDSVPAHPTEVAPAEELEDSRPEPSANASAPQAQARTAGAVGAARLRPRVPAGTSGGTGVMPASLLRNALEDASKVPVPVSSRADWNADEDNMTWEPDYAPARHVVVHHTAGSNSYTAEQSASIVRGIYYYHAVTLGWGDIGYNFLVDKYGQVFEGRYGSLASSGGQMVVGGHARGVNTGTMGISMMGDYSSIEPTSVQLDRVGSLAAWFLGRAGVSDAHGSSAITFKTTERYQAGQSVSMPTIMAHRDVGYTACPGERAYARMGEIRSITQSKLSDVSSQGDSSAGGASQGDASGGGQTGGSSAAGAAGRWELWSGVWYFHNADGSWAKGWLLHDGAWYDLDPASGAMRTGWVLEGAHWYYLSPADGRMRTGWVPDGGAWYLLDQETGAMRTGWAHDGHHWYYLSPASGRMTTGWLKDGERWYYLQPGNGAMRTGWLKDGERWYYLQPGNGAMRTGWLKDGERWYYLQLGNGAMRTGWVEDSSHWYYLNPDSGSMATGWLQHAGSWYYLSPEGGAMVTGWLQHASAWYWLTPGRGNMATGVVLTEGRWSEFSGSGPWLGYTSAPAGHQDAAAAPRSGSVLQADGNGLHKVMAAPSASKQELVGKMVSAYDARGISYPVYALAAAGAATPTDFFTIVYEEAVAEGVSPELLFAQVVKETGWLRFGGDVSIHQNNFGGIGAVGGGVAGNSFPDVRTGLRAQSQHLRAYGDPGATVSGLANPVVDPRFVYVRKGGAQYVEHLGIQENPDRAGWAAARGYGHDLVALIQTYFG